ncbi:phytanoyl-CoA dioxygenase family protein [Aspergillus aculeatinus CBS 121060]|uniref:Phytanoyl-CoA dioxygenase family protein n=1 Tax=Aspergillus aculeatinus CBS 121060 TaxID=1448322 RepID=A0ACD1H1V6_9EURO|nr:phytanoyl-CoA dioxygenase family protein [Aspergillus aculeatinus CBS 121060]RAH67527.1 phytanoyl-CoA dioxygenase family protein [Aspergillus aculeatinus CBS 121060]
MGVINPNPETQTQPQRPSFNRLLSLDSPPPSLPDFQRLCAQTTDGALYPHATTITKNIPIYSTRTLSLTDPDDLTTVQNEWYHILSEGPGIFVLQHFYDVEDDHHRPILTATTAAFNRIIAHEAATSARKGDHFSSGHNARIWNSFSKHAFADPPSFVAYYSNPWLRAVSETWLGPGYRLTAQVNIVRPGGQAQSPHRDYHLGFQDDGHCARFPRGMHAASAFLTLQGAVAHSDMPERSGPTRFLPFSQRFEAGFLAWRRPEFREFFEREYVALPLREGDAVFFNPAVMHAAGENCLGPESGFERRANLLQIGSALGKTMERVDVVPVVEAVWGEVRRRFDGHGHGHGEADAGKEEEELDANWEAFVRALGEGYPFPTNLDRRPPAPNGMAPESEQDLIRRGLLEGWGTEEMVARLRQLQEDERGHQSL